MHALRDIHDGRNISETLQPNRRGSHFSQVLHCKREGRRGIPGEEKMHREMKQDCICRKQLDVERAEDT